MKKIYIDGDTVVKVDMKLDLAWREKLMKIMEYMEIPAFQKFIYRGYVTKFINGKDLQEDFPFLHRHDEVRSYPLNPIQYDSVIKIFKDIVYAGIKTGYILADFTKRNIIVTDDKAYLIDYDIILEELNEDYIRIYQNILNYLKIDYQFDGDLVKLYECLNRLPPRSSV